MAMDTDSNNVLHNPRKSLCQRLVCLVACIGLAGASRSVAADDLASWVPDNTRFFVEVNNFVQLGEKLQTTQFGELWKSESMASFRSQLDVSDTKFSQWLRKRYGIDQALLLKVAAGRLAFTSLEIANERLTNALLFEVSEADSGRLLQDATSSLIAQGARKVEVSGLDGASVFETATGWQVVYLVKDGFMLICGDVDEAKKIVSRWGGASKEGSLASVEAYEKTMASGQAEAASDMHWFADVIRLAVTTEDREDGESNDDPRGPFPTRHGFVGLKGIGGHGWIKPDGFDLLNRIRVYAPSRSGALGALAYEAGPVDTPDYASAGVTSATMINWNVLELFKNIGDVYDDVTDAPGAWQGTLDSWKSDSRFDLVGGLLPLLGREVRMITDRDVEKRLERTVTSIDIPNPADERKVAALIYYFWRNDSSAIREKVLGHKNHLWQIRLSDDSGNASFSKAGMMVTRGRLWIATHASMIRDILQQSDDAKLVDDPLHSQALQRMQPWTGKQTFARGYIRGDRDLSNTYHVLKSDGIDALKDVESIYARAIIAMLTKDGETDNITTDFTKLPPFEKVAPLIGVTATAANVEPDGWSLTIGLFPQ